MIHQRFLFLREHNVKSRDKGVSEVQVRSRRIRGTAGVATVFAFVAAVGFATAAAAQSNAPQIAGSSQADSGSDGQPFLTMVLPNGVSAGQLLLATVAIQGANSSANPWATIDIPWGWNEIGSSSQTCGSDLAMSVAWRIAQSSDSAGTEFTWGFISGGFLTPLLASGSIISVEGVNTTSPIDASSMLCTTQSKQQTAPAVTTVHSDDLNILVYGITGNNFMSEPAGYSQLFQHLVVELGPDITNDYLVIPGAGTNTGARISTASEAGDGIGYQISLAPSGSATNEATKSESTVLKAAVPPDTLKKRHPKHPAQ